MRENNLTALSLSSINSSGPSNFSFLSEMDFIEELDIHCVNCVSVPAIESMNNILKLSLTYATKEKIDFTKLKKLEHCFVDYDPNFNSIFDATWIKSLSLNRLKLKDYSVLSKLKNLQVLTVYSRSMPDLEWVRELPQLEKLWLLDCRKLTDFTPLQCLPKLKNLHIDGSNGLNDLEFLRDMKTLEILNTLGVGEVDSLEPLSKLHKLHAVSFGGARTKIVDGDLSVFETLPNLSMLGFGARRHYTHKLIKKWNWNNFGKPDVLLEKRVAK